MRSTEKNGILLHFWRIDYDKINAVLVESINTLIRNYSLILILVLKERGFILKKVLLKKKKKNQTNNL